MKKVEVQLPTTSSAFFLKWELNLGMELIKMAIVENQKIKVKWHGTNRKHYEGLGYIKTDDQFEVSPHELPEKSPIEILIICDYCGEISSKKRRNLHLNGNHFCTNSCAGSYKFKNNNPNPKKDKINVNCTQCKKEFEVVESITKKNKWHFCSRECYANFRSENLHGDKMYNYQDIKTNCTVCDKEYKTSKWHLENDKDKFCSQDCYYEYRSIFYVGENHPHFGTKITGERLENMRLITAERIANGSFPQTNTTIQIKINEVIKELKFGFKDEIQFKYYVLDFYDEETNLGIEIMGDYWHSNPLKYLDYNSLHDIQKKGIKRDKAKKTFLKKYHNINILYLWEKDINTNIGMCADLLKLFVNNKGVLKDYNSFNYHLTDRNLKLNEEIILPYFMKANTSLQVI